mmetsp:Transcript_18977/g.30670  ORF Transcript_18977/g.30670 Transcript_18977/m.30670 type:complete len:91 (+) Transcript_18977:63-335(+)
MLPKVMKVKRSQGGNLSWCQAFAEAFWPALGERRKRRSPANVTVTRAITCEEEKEKTEIRAHRQSDVESKPSMCTPGADSDGEEEKTEIK